METEAERDVDCEVGAGHFETSGDVIIWNQRRSKSNYIKKMVQTLPSTSWQKRK